MTFALFFGNNLFAQCPQGEIEVVVTIVPDQFPSETSWELRDNQSNLLASATNGVGGSVCVDTSLCLEFTIFDTYGDGICCTYGNGSYNVTYGGTQIVSGGQFGTEESTYLGGCGTGSFCEFADSVGLGSYVANNRDYWYLFVPDSTGTYEITTCGSNTCNTVIWVYDHCQNLQWDNSNQGTAFYNDDDCGVQARLVGHFAAGTPYWVRIGDKNASCTGPISWSLNYVGPVVGCTNPAACNYNPLATVTDTCYFPGDTLCPDGPDLMILGNVVESSMHTDLLQSADPCHVNEGCVTGYGTRDLIRFTTHIKNIGNQDYFIGDAQNNPQMFQYDACHSHYHFAGYAEYVLYDSASQPLPIGFKNGFCVLDLECQGGGTAQYSCGNMGISTGCGDIYDSNLECQWIDITDVPSGRYTLVVRVNWNRLPDALGRVEKDFDNNWAQVCFDLTKDPVPGGHNHTFNILQSCPSIVDCNGVQFGPAVLDCEGICDGTALRGDLNQNLIHETTDGDLYVNGILNNSATLNDCSDLNGDGEISVSDAALINACAIRGDGYLVPSGGIRDYCTDLPNGILNINDSVMIRIGAVDLNAQTVELEILNPDCRVLGYQFEMSGLTLTSADNLIPASEFPDPISVNAAGAVIAVSAIDSSMKKSVSWRPFVRLHYGQLTGPQICIDRIVDIVNGEYEDVLHNITGPCATIVATAESVGAYHVSVFPNPFTESTVLEFEKIAKEKYTLELMDVHGRVVRDYGQINSNQVTIEKGALDAGLYFYRLKGKQEQVGKLLIL